MLLNKPIGLSTPKEPAISGEQFAQEVYDWKGQGKDISVKINSLGGNVYRGWDIVDSIIETKAKTENVGFAYSMAAIALIVGSDRTAYPHSRAMIHAPRRDDGKADNHTKLVQDQFRTILKNHTKFTDAEINDMVDSGKDYFFDAKEQLAKGIVDRIANTGGYNNDVMRLSEKEVYSYINEQLETENESDMDLKNIWAQLTGKQTEGDQIVAYTEMKSENASLKAEKAKYDAELATIKKELEELKAEKVQGDSKSKAEKLVGDAIKAGKFPGINAETKAKLIENATANYDNAKAMIDAIPASKIVAAATIPSSATAKGGDLTYEHLRDNDPKELARIAQEEPELFAQLSAKYIKDEKVK